MDVNRIVSELDSEIARLQHVRASLLQMNGSTGSPALAKRGRPKGVKVVAKSTTKRRMLSPEGRKRIADAMKRRWAERRKAAAKKSSA